MLRIFLIFLVLYSLQIDAFCIKGPHQFSVGPEVGYLHRSREGGSKQDGALCGFNVKYERVRRCALYWCAQYTASWSDLNGNNAAGDEITSRFFEQQGEGRFGYNYQWKTGRKFYILPSVGYGYYRQTNRYVAPSPVEVRFNDYFPYSSFGLQIGCDITCFTSIGFLVKADWVLEGKSKIDDPEEEPFTISFEEKWQYDFELPITHRRQLGRRCLYYVFTPFVRLRHFGGLPGFPMDYADTRYYNYGARFSLAYDF